MRMVSLPTRGTNLRFTASSATSRTVQRAPLRWVAADHGNQPPFLAVVQHLRRAGPLPLVERPFQAAFLIPMADVADGLGSERDDLGDLRRTGASGQLPQRQRTQNDANLLHAATQ